MSYPETTLEEACLHFHLAIEEEALGCADTFSVANLSPAVHQHLDGCAACEQYAHELLAVHRAFASSRLPPPSSQDYDALRDAVMAAVCGPQAAAQPAPQPTPRAGIGVTLRRWWEAVNSSAWRPALAFACALAVVVAAVLVFSPRPSVEPAQVLPAEPVLVAEDETDEGGSDPETIGDESLEVAIGELAAAELESLVVLTASELRFNLPAEAGFAATANNAVFADDSRDDDLSSLEGLSERELAALELALNDLDI